MSIHAKGRPQNAYPGPRATGPVVINAGTAVPLSTYEPSSEPMIPLVAYGANASPQRLTRRFGSAADGCVLLPARMNGAAAAWSCGATSAGEVPATLVASNMSEPVWLLLLPSGLGDLLDRFEGRGAGFYDLVRLPDVTVDVAGVGWEQPLTYLGAARRAPLSLRKQPVLLSERNQEWAQKHRGVGDMSFRPAHHIVPVNVKAIDVVGPGDIAFLRSVTDSAGAVTG